MGARIGLLGVLVIGLFACGRGYESQVVVRPKIDRKLGVCYEQEALGQSEESLSPASFKNYSPESNTYFTPTRKLPLQEWPILHDDLDFSEMDLAISRQIKRFSDKKLKGSILLGGDSYPQIQALRSLERFRDLVSIYSSCKAQSMANPGCGQALRESIREEFNIYVPQLVPGDPRYGEDKQTLFTAYYTPTLKGKKRPDQKFKHAVYNRPASARLRKLSRASIDFRQRLRDRNLELFYADNLFDLYLLHVQGGGRVEIEGSDESFYISYAGTNGRKWNFISNYMYDKGYIRNKSIDAQKEFLDNNPGKQLEIYETCPSYVYFSKTETPPLGSDMVPLTDNRSIATDTGYYKFKGLLSFVKAERPDDGTDFDKGPICGQSLDFKSYSRFFIDQDTGGAIKGKARVDLYYGEGSYAKKAAYNTKVVGNLYFLMLK